MLELSNPLGVMTIWTSAYVAAAEAGVATTLRAMASCCDQVSSALSSAAMGSQRQASSGAAVLAGARDSDSQPLPANVVRYSSSRTARSGGSAKSALDRAGSDPTRSWYRAPYRSPFDPVFWLTPGADWDPLMQMMGPFHPLAVRSSLHPSMALFWAGTPLPMLRQAVAPEPSLSAFAPFESWASTLSIGWRDWYTDVLSTPALAAPVNAHAPPRASYRTDGGHAAGMVAWQPATAAASSERETNAGARADVIEDWSYLFAPWLRR
jgi:hypothetical protein